MIAFELNVNISSYERVPALARVSRFRYGKSFACRICSWRIMTCLNWDQIFFHFTIEGANLDYYYNIKTGEILKY